MSNRPKIVCFVIASFISEVSRWNLDEIVMGFFPMGAQYLFVISFVDEYDVDEKPQR